ncbi:MAG: hypothetical protein AAF337_03065 [Pseudomonadota bacterium]
MKDDGALVVQAQIIGTVCQGVVGDADFRNHFRRVGEVALSAVFVDDAASAKDSSYTIIITPTVGPSRIMFLTRGVLTSQTRAEVTLGADVLVIAPTGKRLAFGVPPVKETKLTDASVEVTCNSAAVVLYDAMNDAMGKVYQQINDKIAAEFAPTQQS